MLSPIENGVVVPARHAYSHSASLGKRAFKPGTNPFSLARKHFVSFQLTRSAGLFLSSVKLLGLFPITACHKAWVQALSASQKPCVNLT